MNPIVEEMDAALADIAGPSSQRLAVRVTRDAQRQMRGGHPWIFDRSITRIPDGGSSGDLAVIFNEDRDFLGIGLYDPDSPIRIRVLHQGKPKTIDSGFWKDRAEAAVLVRRPLFDGGKTTGFRVINGENDGFGGLVADIYDRTLVVKIYSRSWYPHLRQVLAALVGAVPPPGVERVVVRLSRQTADYAPYPLGDGVILAGSHLDGPVNFTESGLAFSADVLDGPKTGFFCDQRENRTLAARYAKGERVLDVFSCSGGFSIAAAAAGARSVHSLDINAHSISDIYTHRRMNMSIPAVADCHFDSTVGEAFATMEQMVDDGLRFGLVIIDPPSFASRQSHIPAAISSYERLAELGARLVAGSGVMFSASCSARVTPADFREAVQRGVSRSGREMTIESYSGHALDHPVTYPEGEYLTAMVSRLK